MIMLCVLKHELSSYLVQRMGIFASIAWILQAMDLAILIIVVCGYRGNAVSVRAVSLGPDRRRSTSSLLQPWFKQKT